MVIFVPFKLLKVVHKIESRLVRVEPARSMPAAGAQRSLTPPPTRPLPPRVQLEKKFSGKHVVIIGQRRHAQPSAKRAAPAEAAQPG